MNFYYKINKNEAIYLMPLKKKKKKKKEKFFKQKK